MARVTSSELERDFDRYGELAEREPVTITKNGHDRLVLVSVEEFARLKALDTRKAYHPSELPDDILEALERAEPPTWTEKFNSEWP